MPDEGAIARAVADALRRAAPAITGIGVLLLCLELLIGAVPPPWRTALIIAGIALAGGSWLWDLLHDGSGKRRSLIAIPAHRFSVAFGLAKASHPRRGPRPTGRPG